MTVSGIIASVVTTGDSYDNALYKSEVIEYLKEQWNGVNDVELVTLEWEDWFNKTRLLSTINYVSPFEFEKRCYDNLILSGMAALSKSASDIVGAVEFGKDSFLVRGISLKYSLNLVCNYMPYCF